MKKLAQLNDDIANPKIQVVICSDGKHLKIVGRGVKTAGTDKDGDYLQESPLSMAEIVARETVLKRGSPLDPRTTPTKERSR